MEDLRGVGGDTGEPKRAQITAKTEREGKPWEHRGFCLLLSLWLTFPTGKKKPRVHGLGVVWGYTETTAVGQLSPKPFSGGLPKHNPSEAELQMPKSKVRTSRDFPGSRDFDGLGLCFSLGRWCFLVAWVHDNFSYVKV